MFKSIFQPLQLFIKGASGKDRHEKQQLMQQVLTLQLAYDDLQENCDQQLETKQAVCDQLQHECNALKQKYTHLQTRYDSLQQQQKKLQNEHTDLTAVFNYAEQENKDFSTNNQQLCQQLQQLQKDNQVLKSETIYLAQQLEIKAYQQPETHARLSEPASTGRSPSASTASSLAHQAGNQAGSQVSSQAGSQAGSHLANGKLLARDSISQQPGVSLGGTSAEVNFDGVDLSTISLALIGGHETTHREVSAALRKYGLKRCVHVPPHSIASNSRSQIKDKISQCDLVITITSYVDHSVVRCVKQLKEAQMLAGEVIRMSSHGKSSVVREVLSYFATRQMA
ncbi:MAG: DUF2325 domain-containing protein [Cyanobacteria bacterium P01_A01_bin.116]